MTEDEALAELQRANLTAAEIAAVSKTAAAKSRKVALAIVTHPRAPRHISVPLLRRMFTFDLMQVSLTPAIAADIKRAAEDQIVLRQESLSAGEKISLAKRASGRVAAILLQENDDRVIEPALDNAQLTEALVVQALMKPRAPELLFALVSGHRKWSQRREVQIACGRIGPGYESRKDGDQTLPDEEHGNRSENSKTTGRLSDAMNLLSNNSLLGMDVEGLTCIVEEAGQPLYRARQLFQALYAEGIQSVDDISTLPLEFRQFLTRSGLQIGLPEIAQRFVSSDGTVRYLMRLKDGETIETVWMPEGDGGEAGDGSESDDEAQESRAREWRRATICVSSQVGCAVNCQFCLTALLGVKRNLTAGEIVGQVIAVLNDQNVSPPLERVNLVFMGMGEPFLNFDNFLRSVRLLVEGVGIPPSRMTVSTAGIVPRIYDLARELIRPKLAISLTAPNDDLRSRLMPINRKWNLEKLIAAAKEFPLRNRERMTFEYVLLRGVNDAAQHARELAELIRGIRAKVNLIALNPGPGVDFQTPDQQVVEAFQDILSRAGIPAFVRRPRGRDIYAACGQLKRTVEPAS